MFTRYSPTRWLMVLAALALAAILLAVTFGLVSSTEAADGVPPSVAVQCEPTLQSTVHFPNQPVEPGVWGVLEDPDGKVWLLSYVSGGTGQFFYLNPQWTQDLRVPSKLPMVDGQYDLTLRVGPYSNHPSDQALLAMPIADQISWEVDCGNEPPQIYTVYLPAIKQDRRPAADVVVKIGRQFTSTQPGEIVTYLFSVINVGPDRAENIQVIITAGGEKFAMPPLDLWVGGHVEIPFTIVVLKDGNYVAVSAYSETVDPFLVNNREWILD